MWKTVLFDLDGTLTDSAEGITKCVRYALEEMGLEAPELSDLNCFVGPPLHDMFMKYAHMDAENADRAVELYRERYVPTGMYENRLYPRIAQLLDLLKKNGITLGVASSKPEIYVKDILRYFGIDDYFKVIVGSELNGERVQKKDVLEEAIYRLKMEKKRDQVVLVGDTEYDVKGAHDVGISCIAVSYGYGSREKLEEAGPIYIADSVSDIAECLLLRQPKQRKESGVFQIWRVLYPILIHLGLSVMVTIACGLAYAVYQVGLKQNYDVEAFSQNLTTYHSNLIMMAASIASIIVFIGVFRSDEWNRKELGIRNRLMTADRFGIVRIMLVAAFFALFSTFLNQLISWSGIANLFTAYNQVAQSLFLKDTILRMIIAFVALGFFVPIAEELLFRGLVYRRIRDYSNVKTAVVVSALLFGLYHGNMVQFIFATLVGIALAMVYERYKTLWAPIVAHMAVNCFACVLEFTAVKIVPITMWKFMVMILAEILVISVLGTIVLNKWKPTKKAKRVRTVVEEEELSFTEEDELSVYEEDTEAAKEDVKELEENETVLLKANETLIPKADETVIFEENTVLPEEDERFPLAESENSLSAEEPVIQEAETKKTETEEI